MLKLEKSSPHAPITITLRERESFLNSLLLKAFFIALLIHLGIVMLFRIQPFLIKAEFFIPQPVFKWISLIQAA